MMPRPTKAQDLSSSSISLSSFSSSPSDARRLALRQADVGNTIRVLDSYPLSKYFDIAQRLLDAFQKEVDARRLDEAYVYGLRFAAFGVESLPKHKEWRSSRYSKQKRRNSRQVEKVISMMEIIKQRMDAEELMLQERRRVQEEERQTEEDEEIRQRQRESEEQKQREERYKELELEKKRNEEKKVQSNSSVEQSAMAKLLAMQSQISAPRQKPSSTPIASKKKYVAMKAEEDCSSSKQTVKKSNKRTVKTEPSLVLMEEKRTDNAVSRSSADMKTSGGESSNFAPESRPTNSASALPPSPPSRVVVRKMTPRSSGEQNTIDLLETTIRLQEQRLVDIETKQIPTLVRMAKEYLQQDPTNRDAALKCAARKRSLERQMDAIKAAIFNMETQMFMLENAIEDRQVHKALEEASHAMKCLQQTVGVSEGTSVDLTDLAAALPPSMLDQEEDDEELSEELQGWISPDRTKKCQSMNKDDDDVSILSMPNVPAKSAGISSRTAKTQHTDTSGMEKVLKPVLG